MKIDDSQRSPLAWLWRSLFAASQAAVTIQYRAPWAQSGCRGR